MAVPTNKVELLAAVDAEFTKLHEQVLELDAEDRLRSGACDAWSVKDLLAHIAEWHVMFLEWERIGSEGGKPEMPAPGYAWKETPALNAAIWNRTKDDAFKDVAKRLHASQQAVRRVIESYGDEELFEKRRFPWTGSTSVAVYARSATSSHYMWANKLIKKYATTLA